MAESGAAFRAHTDGTYGSRHRWGSDNGDAARRSPQVTKRMTHIGTDQDCRSSTGLPLSGTSHGYSCLRRLPTSCGAVFLLLALALIALSPARVSAQTRDAANTRGTGVIRGV